MIGSTGTTCPLCAKMIESGQSRTMWWPDFNKLPGTVHRTCKETWDTMNPPLTDCTSKGKP